MDKKLVIGGFVIVILLGIILWPSEEIEEEISFSEYPTDWIDNSTIDVLEATEGKGDFSLGHERVIDNGRIISLEYEGFYKGESFGNTYGEDEILMEIGEDMDPNDGIIEAFALFKEEDGEFVIYLFVDEDWKEKSRGKINIIWGKDINDNVNIMSRQFDFATSQNGIYIDRISGASWLIENPVIGRLFFGELTKQDVIENKFDRTFVMLI